MEYCLNQLQFESKEIPVYALLLDNFKIIDEYRNLNEKHAEIIIIENNNVQNLDILITLEPCPSCLFYLAQKKIKNIFFGGFNYQYGSCCGKFNMLDQIDIYKPKVFGGFLKNESENLISEYFKLNLRKKNF